MRAITSLLLLSLLGFSTQTSVEEVMEFIVRVSDELLASSKEPDGTNVIVPDINTKMNFIYEALKKKLIQTILDSTEVSISHLELASKALTVENATIYGVNNTLLIFDGPKTGFNIDNLTLSIPYLNISADSYTMNELNLLDTAIISGSGLLNIYLEDIYLSVKLKISLSQNKLIVKNVPIFHCRLGKAKFNLQNIGNGGEQLEYLLNSIASDIFPIIVNSLENDVQSIINIPEEWAKVEPYFNNLFSAILNSLKENIAL